MSKRSGEGGWYIHSITSTLDRICRLNTLAAIETQSPPHSAFEKRGSKDTGSVRIIIHAGELLKCTLALNSDAQAAHDPSTSV